MSEFREMVEHLEKYRDYLREPRAQQDPIGLRLVASGLDVMRKKLESWEEEAETERRDSHAPEGPANDS